MHAEHGSFLHVGEIEFNVDPDVWESTFVVVVVVVAIVVVVSVVATTHSCKLASLCISVDFTRKNSQFPRGAMMVAKIVTISVV